MGKLRMLKPKTKVLDTVKVKARPAGTTDWGCGRGGRPWRRLREEILKRDDYLCQCEECQALGRVRPGNEVDHIVPRSQGGKDDPSNLRAINDECHKLKTRRESQPGT